MGCGGAKVFSPHHGSLSEGGKSSPTGNPTDRAMATFRASRTTLIVECEESADSEPPDKAWADAKIVLAAESEGPKVEIRDTTPETSSSAIASTDVSSLTDSIIAHPNSPVQPDASDDGSRRSSTSSGSSKRSPRRSTTEPAVYTPGSSRVSVRSSSPSSERESSKATSKTSDSPTRLGKAPRSKTLHNFQDNKLAIPVSPSEIGRRISDTNAILSASHLGVLPPDQAWPKTADVGRRRASANCVIQNQMAESLVMEHDPGSPGLPGLVDASCPKSCNGTRIGRRSMTANCLAVGRCIEVVAMIDRRNSTGDELGRSKAVTAAVRSRGQGSIDGFC